MVKYYAYYSFGGYRELYLGNSNDSFEHSWFFSMLPIWEERLKESDDNALRAKIEEARNLPHIEDVGKGGENAIPAEASALVSHGGYDVIYKSAGAHQVLAIKDIDSRDDSGRPAPFMILFVAVDIDGAAVLDKLAEYLLANLSDFKNKATDLFTYDINKNGLRFNITLMNKILEEVIEQTPSLKIPWHEQYPVHTMITAQSLDVALQNQSLSKDDVYYAVNLNGKVLCKKRRQIKETQKEEEQQEKPKEEPQGEPDSLDQAPETNSEQSTDSKELITIKHNTEESFFDYVSDLVRKFRMKWNNLPRNKRYCILTVAVVLLLIAIAPRSCSKSNNRTAYISKTLYHEKAL